MAPTLPFAFDTTATPTMIVRGILGLVALAVVGVLYSLLVSRNPAGVIAMGLVGVIALYVGFRAVQGLEAATGTIQLDGVDVKRASVFGIPLAGPSGRFSLQAFRSVRVELVAPSVEVFGTTSRVVLASRDGTTDILVARTGGEGRDLARALAELLGLPFEERHTPY